uniref:Secreted protein n=1 Tax=Steinernema glaseri TaxID=37863 RepID=A0A1I7YU96_9BILA
MISIQWCWFWTPTVDFGLNQVFIRRVCLKMLQNHPYDRFCCFVQDFDKKSLLLLTSLPVLWLMASRDNTFYLFFPGQTPWGVWPSPSCFLVFQQNPLGKFIQRLCLSDRWINNEGPSCGGPDMLQMGIAWVKKCEEKPCKDKSFALAYFEQIL